MQTQQENKEIPVEENVPEKVKPPAKKEEKFKKKGPVPVKKAWVQKKIIMEDSESDGEDPNPNDEFA